MKTQLHIKIITVAMLFFISESTFSQASLLKDIYTGPISGAPSEVLDMGTYGIFRARSGDNGFEPWITDGTTDGTVILKDIFIGNTNSYPQFMTKVNDLVFFSATTTLEGQELWKTDGTEAGTMLVKDIAVGEDKNAYVRNFIEFNGKLFFTADLDASNNQVIWKSDGTEEGTVQVKNILPDVLFGFPYVSKFVTTDFGLIFFSATDGIHGRELWITDGTEAGTIMVKDINVGSGDAGIIHITALGGNVYFQVLDAGGVSSLWKSDGTDAGTSVVVTDLNIENFTEFVVFNDKIYFSCKTVGDTNGTELWVSDGTAPGTKLFKDINPGSSSSTPSSFVEAGDKLFFKAVTDTEGVELWVTDGTETGTNLVKDINPGINSSLVPSDSEKRLKAIGNKVYFAASDGSTSGDTLWVSDGTEAGTISLANVDPAGDDDIEEIIAINDIILFKATTPTYGTEFWRLDTELSTTDYSGLSKLKIFPNPVSNTLSIEHPYSGAVQLKVFNQLGQLVLKQNQTANSLLLDVSELSKGLYILSIDAEDGTIQTKKFIKN